MSEIKRINPTTLSLALKIGLIKLRKEANEWWDKLPDARVGVFVEKDMALAKFEEVIERAVAEIEGLVGKLPEVEIPEETEYTTMDKEFYRRNQTYYMKTYKNKRFQWMNQTGAYYGGPMLAIYNNTGTKMLIPDAKVTHGLDGNKDNINQPYYFCGTDPEHQHGMGGRASIFSAPNSPDTTVTVYFDPKYEFVDNIVPDLPEVEDVVPEQLEKIGSWSMKPYTRTPGNEKSAGRAPLDFNKHDYPVKFVFDNNCGSFIIPTANAEYDKEGKEGYYFHKWHKGSPVVFTRAGCVASKVTAYKVL